jgi:hypothetical protein
MENGAAAEFLACEVKDREGADLRCRPGLLLASCNRDGSDEIAPGYVQREIAIAAARHGCVEYGLPATQAEIQRFNRLRVG